MACAFVVDFNRIINWNPLNSTAVGEMMKSSLKGNLAMIAAKTISGLNENALRYLLPRWMSARTGVFLRLSSGFVILWLISLFNHKTGVKATWKERLQLMALGALFVFGYMWTLNEGLCYTTPISSSIFISMQPVWVYVIAVAFMHDRFTARKTTGILLGLGGALVCILTQQKSEVAADPFKGNMLCLASSLIYSVYLVLEKQLLNRRLDSLTVSKWVFLGGTVSASVFICFVPWYAPVLSQGLFSAPMLVLLFVCVFSSALGYLLVTVGLKELTPTTVAIYGYLILAVATIASYILGQDHFSWWQMLSIGLIVVSVYMVEIAEMKPAGSSQIKPAGH